MQQPTMRFVWDRKNVATTKEKKALVQLELVFGRKKKYISTGIHLYKGEWDNVMWVKNRFDQEELNERLRNHYKRVYKACNEVCKKGEFTFEKLERELKRTSGSETFIEYVDRRIKERNDIKASTKKNHRKLVTMLHGYEKIVDFSDLTRGNINDFYNYLLGLNIRQLTVSSYVKNLKVYIHDAMAHDMIRTDPCAGMKFKRGESEEGRWLSVDELKKIEDLEDLGFLQTARDLFLLQCYMGVAYADLMDFDKGKLEEADGGLLVLKGKRIKTNADYVSVVIPKAKALLEKYDFKIPRISNQKYNDRLKLISEKAEINKPLASHWGRRTCGMILLNDGYPIEVVAKVLGHTDIRTTQKAYAKILSSTVVDKFKEIEGKKKSGGL